MDLEYHTKKLYEQDFFKYREPFSSNNSNSYKITMENSFLNAKGEIFKSQKLSSEYRRNITKVIENYFAYTDLVIDNVLFWKSANDKPMHWTFAEGVVLPYYIYCLDDFSAETINKYDITQESVCVDDFKKEQITKFTNLINNRNEEFNNELKRFPKFTSCSLFIMQAYDIITFDLFASHFFSEFKLFEDINKDYEINNFSDVEIFMQLNDTLKNSTFKNGKFITKFMGISYLKGIPCFLVNFECNSSKINTKDTIGNLVMKKEGTSHFNGYIYICAKTGKLIEGNMRENVICLQENIINKKVEKSSSNCIRNIKIEIMQRSEL